MKTIFSIIIIVFTAHGLFAQNTYPWPSTGNIGIGTQTPAYTLDITGPSITTLRIGSTSSNTSNSSLIFSGDNGSNHGSWQFSKSPSTFTGQLVLSYNTGVYGGYHPMMFFNYNSSSGAVVIGSSASLAGGCTLAVEGKIGARELVISNSSPFPDYVFAPTYKLRPLSETEKFIKQYSHLPEMPSAEDVERDGLEVGKVTTILVQKVEELTLRIIEMDKKIKRLEQENRKHKQNNN